MAEIVLARVDSRLVHGQVVTKWVNQVMATRILIISDTLVKDPFMLQIYEMATPPGVKVSCLSEEDSIRQWKERQLGEGKILLLFPDIKVLKRVVDHGLRLSKIQVGGLGGGPTRKAIYKNITLDQKDFEDLKALHDQGIEIKFQIIPEDSPFDFTEIKAFK